MTQSTMNIDYSNMLPLPGSCLTYYLGKLSSDFLHDKHVQLCSANYQ